MGVRFGKKYGSTRKFGKKYGYLGMAAIKSIHAVLTGDIVLSTAIPFHKEPVLMEALSEALSAYTAEFYRGDSFQAYLEDPRAALRTALLCRAAAIGLTVEEEGVAYSDVRIGIGIGTVNGRVTTLGTAKGDAFLWSGRMLDQLQATEQRLSIVCKVEMADIGFAVMSDYLDMIFKGMTVKQARVIMGLLQGQTQLAIAERMNKSKSTVSQLAAAGHWEEIVRLLYQFEQLINLIENGNGSAVGD